MRVKTAMVRRFYMLAAALSLGAAASCDIGVLPETVITGAGFWNSVGDVRLAANHFYRTLPGLANEDVIQDNWSTDAYPNDKGDPISEGSRTAPAENKRDYNDAYDNIYQANQLIEKAPEVIAKGADATEVNRYVGEARFFRAFYYFEMLKRFGGVPLITKTMTVKDPDIFLPRADRDEVLQLIYDDLDYAISVLRTADEIDAAREYGRISKTGAQAFKSRVALFEGTRAKYHSYGDPTKHLTLAKEAAEAVILSGQHEIFSTPTTGADGETLNDAYFNLFQQAGQGRANRENIVVRTYGISPENRVVTTPVQRYYEGSRVVPTQNFVDSYLMADGLPNGQSPLYQAPDATMTHAEYFEKKDPRMAFTIFKRGDEYISSSLYTVPNATFQRSGYAIRKYANERFWNLSASYIDKPVIRYAEVLLNYAEVLYELNGGITDTELNSTINQIRGRLPQVNIGTAASPNFVSLPALTNAFAAANGLDLLAEIRRERRVELAFEGFTYWDLIRWKTAETELPTTLRGSYLFTEMLDAAWDPKTPVDGNNFILLQNAALRKFDPAKDYLWPLPLTELAKNDKLVQNPGW